MVKTKIVENQFVMKIILINKTLESAQAKNCIKSSYYEKGDEKLSFHGKSS